MNIYFICTGNTCRSPMAEAVLRSKNLEGVNVRSGGIHAQDRLPISANSKTLIEEKDFPFTSLSRAVSKEDLEWADLILTMTHEHKDILIHSFSNVDKKTFTLKGFVDVEGDVHDPYGGNLLTYRRTFDELVILMDELERKL